LVAASEALLASSARLPTFEPAEALMIESRYRNARTRLSFFQTVTFVATVYKKWKTQRASLVLTFSRRRWRRQGGYRENPFPATLCPREQRQVRYPEANLDRQALRNTF
jgi:hypothetical protein